MKTPATTAMRHTTTAAMTIPVTLPDDILELLPLPDAAAAIAGELRLAVAVFATGEVLADGCCEGEGSGVDDTDGMLGLDDGSGTVLAAADSDGAATVDGVTEGVGDATAYVSTNSGGVLLSPPKNTMESVTASPFVHVTSCSRN
jgi:hypothetical protein